MNTRILKSLLATTACVTAIAASSFAPAQVSIRSGNTRITFGSDRWHGWHNHDEMIRHRHWNRVHRTWTYEYPVGYTTWRRHHR